MAPKQNTTPSVNCIPYTVFIQKLLNRGKTGTSPEDAGRAMQEAWQGLTLEEQALLWDGRYLEEQATLAHLLVMEKGGLGFLEWLHQTRKTDTEKLLNIPAGTKSISALEMAWLAPEQFLHKQGKPLLQTFLLAVLAETKETPKMLGVLAKNKTLPLPFLGAYLQQHYSQQEKNEFYARLRATNEQGLVAELERIFLQQSLEPRIGSKNKSL